MAIPKKIHYIWVGGKEKPKYVKHCINTWKKIFNDYEIIEWNEKNFDINAHRYTQNAYKAKKWAFVSDYIRAHVLYNEGGIYLDTDVIAVEEFGELLNNDFFIGFETNEFISAAILGSAPNHILMKELLEYYDNLDTTSFKFEDNNSILITDILKTRYNCNTNNTEQLLNNNIKVYKDTVLSNPSNESKTIHVFSGTWLDGKKKLRKKVNEFIKYRLTTKKRISLYLKIMKRSDV